MGLFDKLFGSNKKQEPEESKLKISPSGMPYVEAPARKGPWSAKNHMDEAASLFIIGEPKKALTHINKAIEMDSQNPVAYAVRASIRRKIGDVKGAELDEYKSKELTPENDDDDDDIFD